MKLSCCNVHGCDQWRDPEEANWPEWSPVCPKHLLDVPVELKRRLECLHMPGQSELRIAPGAWLDAARDCLRHLLSLTWGGNEMSPQADAGGLEGASGYRARGFTRGR